MTGASPIDAYLAGLPADQRAALERLRKQVVRLVPDAVETISYGMPTFLKSTAAHCSCSPAGRPTAASTA